MMRRWMLAWGLLPLSLGAALLVGCDSDHTICAPAVPAARLTGHVRTGGYSATLTLTAVRVDLRDGEMAEYPTVPAADGAYTLDVAPGQYVLKLNQSSYKTDYVYTAFGPGYGSTPADTLRVETGHTYRNLDFDLGTLTVQVTLPDSSLDGEHVNAILHRADADGEGWDPDFYWMEYTRVEQNQAELKAVSVLPGRYQVELVLGARSYSCGGPMEGEHIWLPDASGPDQAAWYDVEVGSLTALTYTTQALPAHLSGHIRGAWLELGMYTAPQISVIDADSVTAMGKRKINADGSFELALYRPRPVKLLITHKGMAQYLGGPDFDSATVYDLAPGQTIADIETATCAITLDTSTPLSTRYGAGDFEIYDPDGLILLGTVVGQFCIKSSYILPNLWPGEFLIRAVPQSGVSGQVGWIPQWYPGVTEPEAAERIVLTQEGEILPLSMTVLTGGNITGDIVDAPDPDAWWYALLTPAADPTTWGQNYIFGPRTDYSLTGIPDGQWKIGVCLIYAADDTIWYPGTADWDAAGIITIHDAETVLGVDIHIP